MYRSISTAMGATSSRGGAEYGINHSQRSRARVMVSERVNLRTKWRESRLAIRFRMNEELGCSEPQTPKARTTFFSELTARVSPRPSRSY
jgi:hypothetical protein